MAWIEFHASRIKKLQKFGDFRRALNWSANEALGFLGSFWSEVIDLREDGDITGWRPEYIVELTEAKAMPERLWSALEGGWIESRPDGKVLIHDWLDTASKFLMKKYSGSDEGKQRLTEIWLLHGKVYGKSSDRIETGKRPESDPTFPFPSSPNQTKNKKHASASPPGGVGAAPRQAKPPGKPREGPQDAPYAIKTPGQAIVALYKTRRGIDLEDRGWDKVQYPRNKKAAEELLILCGKDADKAAKVLEGLGDYFERKGLDWTLETIVSRASDWMTGRMK